MCQVSRLKKQLKNSTMLKKKKIIINHNMIMTEYRDIFVFKQKIFLAPS